MSRGREKSTTMKDNAIGYHWSVLRLWYWFLVIVTLECSQIISSLTIGKWLEKKNNMRFLTSVRHTLITVFIARSESGLHPEDPAHGSRGTSLRTLFETRDADKSFETGWSRHALVETFVIMCIILDKFMFKLVPHVGMTSGLADRHEDTYSVVDVLRFKFIVERLESWWT